MLSNACLVLGIIVVVPLALAAGCGQSQIDKPLSAVLVGYPDESIHSPSGPRGMFVESEGNTRCLYSLYSDATILLFLDESCLDPNSSVVRAARAKESGVSIVEIAAPAADCGAHEECVRARGADVGSLASICDPRNSLRGWYEVGSPSKVVVVDRDGLVRAIGTLDDFDRLLHEAQDVAHQAKSQQSEGLWDKM